MKYISVFIFFNVMVISSFGQQSGDISTRIAGKMKDSLSLTEAQRNSVYNINVLLQNQKANARAQFMNNDTLRRKIQSIENTRDSLYRTVLSQDYYILYKQKKKSLVTANN